MCGAECSSWDQGAFFFNRRNDSSILNPAHVSVCKAPGGGGRHQHHSANRTRTDRKKLRDAHHDATLLLTAPGCVAECVPFCKQVRAVNHCHFCRCGGCA